MAPKAQQNTAKASVKASDSQSVATPTLSRPEETMTPMTPKNFRNHPDMENFFRFIYENDLRIEALEIIDHIIVDRKARRGAKKSQPNA